MKNPLEGNGKPLPRLAGRDWSDDEILSVMEQRGEQKKPLLRVNIEIGDNECPLRCRYCYSNSGEAQVTPTLSFAEIVALIDEAVSLGARSIILTGGGEPLLKKNRYKEIIDHVLAKGATPVVFTCGVTITPDVARWLFDHDVTVITKLNSTHANPAATNDLSGRDDAHHNMTAAIEALLKAGYPGDDPLRLKLGVESVITQTNYNEIVPLWRWIRDRGLFPYIELTKLMGRARQEKWRADNAVDVSSARRLFELVAQVDREEYGYHWEPIPPIMASQCTCYFCGCYIDMFGQVQPCSGVTTDELGNAVADPGGLTAIVNDSDEFHHRVRNILNRLNGRCAKCPLSGVLVGCYGCRAHSFWEGPDPGNPSYDYFGGDPLCWIIPERAAELKNLLGNGQ